MKFLIITAFSFFFSSVLNAADLRVLQINNKKITVEIASTSLEREIGLMYRKELPAEQGMLFKFEFPDSVCMWMKNTYIPLSVAFIDKNGIIINIEKMDPLTENIHCSRGPALYALEMNQGWFQKYKIKSGDKVSSLK